MRIRSNTSHVTYEHVLTSNFIVTEKQTKISRMTNSNSICIIRCFYANGVLVQPARTVHKRMHRVSLDIFRIVGVHVPLKKRIVWNHLCPSTRLP